MKVEKIIIGVISLIAIGAIGTAIYFGVNKLKNNSNLPVTNTNNTVDNKNEEPFVHFYSNSISININDEYDLDQLIKLKNVDIENIIFESSDNNIVSIENRKIISHNNSGTATITAKYNGLETQLLVYVENPKVYSFNINQSEYYLYVGETINIDYKYYPEDATDIDFSWTTSDSNIVSIEQNKITGKKVGVATITLKNNKMGCNVEEDYDCDDTSTAKVYVVNHKINFEYLNNKSYKVTDRISDEGHEDYINELYENENYDAVESAIYKKDYYIRVTFSNLNNVAYTNDDLKIETKNHGATDVIYSYIGKDEKITNAYLYKVTYTFDESKADTENHSDTTFKLPDGSVSIFRVYSEDAYHCYNACKPILYLYPSKTTTISVKLKYPSYITTSYPKYDNGWVVNVDSYGNMYDKLGKSYYALYWDEKYYTSKDNKVDFKSGFYIESTNAIEFLEEKLTYIGLNDKEKNEFIIYWLPILEKNEKNIVYFELTKEREKNNKLEITPTPDSLLRVIMHVKKVNKKVNIKEQKLERFNRYGFTAVEWGGVNHQ